MIRMSTLSLLFNLVLKTVDRLKKKKKKQLTAIQIEKENCLFTDDIFIYTNESTATRISALSLIKAKK